MGEIPPTRRSPTVSLPPLFPYSSVSYPSSAAFPGPCCPCADCASPPSNPSPSLLSIFTVTSLVLLPCPTSFPMTALARRLASAKNKCSGPIPKRPGAGRRSLPVPLVFTFPPSRRLRSAGEAQSPLPSTPFISGSYPHSPCVLPDSRSLCVPSTPPPSDSSILSPDLSSLYVPTLAPLMSLQVPRPLSPSPPALSSAPLISLQTSVPLMSLLVPRSSFFSPPPLSFPFLSLSHETPSSSSVRARFCLTTHLSVVTKARTGPDHRTSGGKFPFFSPPFLVPSHNPPFLPLPFPAPRVRRCIGGG